MSELIQHNDNRATIRWKLLTGVSALALTAYVSSANFAKAEDADRPIVWIDLGGQMEQMQGVTGSFTAPFMSVTPTPAPYRGNIFDQSAPRFSFGEDGKISFQPEDSDWIFSAGIRYGRSHSNRHAHHQTKQPNAQFTFYFAYYHTNVHLSSPSRPTLSPTRNCSPANGTPLSISRWGRMLGSDFWDMTDHPTSMPVSALLSSGRNRP